MSALNDTLDTKFENGTYQYDKELGIIIITNASNGKNDYLCIENYEKHRKNLKHSMVQIQFVNTIYSNELNILRNKKYNIDKLHESIIILFNDDNKNCIDDFCINLINSKKAFIDSIPSIIEKEKINEKLDIKSIYLKVMNYIAINRSQKEAKINIEYKNKCEEAKKNLLSANEELNSSYQHLVLEQGVLNDESFWKQNNDLLIAALPKLELDMPTTISKISNLNDIKTENIYIQKRYNELVLGRKLSEAEFWANLKQSIYYAILTGTVETSQLKILTPNSFFDNPSNFENYNYFLDKNLQNCLSIDMDQVINLVIDSDVSLEPDPKYTRINIIKEQSETDTLIKKYNMKESLFDRINSYNTKYLAELEQFDRNTTTNNPQALVDSLLNSIDVNNMLSLAILSTIDPMFQTDIKSSIAYLTYIRKQKKIEQKTINTDLMTVNKYTTNTVADQYAINYTNIEERNINNNNLADSSVKQYYKTDSIQYDQNINSNVSTINNEYLKSRALPEAYYNQILDKSYIKTQSNEILFFTNKAINTMMFAKFTKILQNRINHEKQILVDYIENNSELVSQILHIDYLKSKLINIYNMLYTDKVKIENKNILCKNLMDYKNELLQICSNTTNFNIELPNRAYINLRSICEPIVHSIDHVLNTFLTS